MLQKIVDFCAQTLRETSEAKKLLQDLERGQREGNGSKDFNSSKDRSQKTQPDISGETSNNIFRIPSITLLKPQKDPERIRILEEFWDKIVPYSLDDFVSGSVSEIAERFSFKPRPHSSNVPSLDEALSQMSEFEAAFDETPNWEMGYLHFFKDRAMKGEVNVDVLLTCWLCKNIPIWKCITLGDLLRVCYHHGIFRQPKTVGSPEDLRFLLEQILELATCALLMNDIYALYDVAMYDEISGRDWIRKELKGILSRRRSIQEVLGIRLSQIATILHLNLSNKHALKGAEGDTIRVDDLDVRSLKEIGRLEIRWTVFLEDHLKLDLQNKILSVVYDQPEVAGLGPMARWQHL